jgi:hypothetical protein
MCLCRCRYRGVRLRSDVRHLAAKEGTTRDGRTYAPFAETLLPRPRATLEDLMGLPGECPELEERSSPYTSSICPPSSIRFVALVPASQPSAWI